MEFGKFLSNITPLLVIAIVVTGFVIIAKGKGDGKGILDQFRAKKIILLEFVLICLNLIEGLVAADTGVLHGLNYSVRLSMHLTLALTSAIAGLTMFRQFQELTSALYIKHEKKFSIIAKETGDVVISFLLTIIPPLANTWFIAIGRGAQVEVASFFVNLFSFKFIQALLSFSDGTTFVSTVILLVHIIGIFYLALFGMDIEETKKEPEKPIAVPVPASTPVTSSSDTKAEIKDGLEDIDRKKTHPLRGTDPGDRRSLWRR